MQLCSRLARRALAIPFLASASGCFPAITHGPRIENGFIIGVTGGLASGDTHVEGDEGGIHLRQPVIGPFLGYGIAPSRPDLPGFYLGAAVPVFFPATQIDAFLQLPPAWTGRLSMGAGGVASLDGVTGYTMLGGQFNATAGWHVGAGFGTRQSSSRFQSSSPAWLGSAAIEAASGHLRTQFFLQFADGRIPGSCFNDPLTSREVCSRGERATAMTLGVSLARHQRSVRTP